MSTPTLNFDKLTFDKSQFYANYVRVLEWNKEFGAVCNTTPVKSLSQKVTDYRYNIIAEEVKELSAAIKNKDIEETWDGLCDILVTVYGALGTFGYPLNIFKCDTTPSHNSLNSEENIKYDKDIFEKQDSVNSLATHNNLLLLLLTELKKLSDKSKFKALSVILNSMVRVTLCMAFIAKLDINKGMKIVNESNFSKGCKTEKEAKETVDAYKKDKMGKFHPNATYRKSQGLFIVYDKLTLKILKNINWKEPDFSELMK